jgi:hypothetical protein
VTSLDGNICRIKAGDLQRVTCAWTLVEITRTNSGGIEFVTESGKTYDILP